MIMMVSEETLEQLAARQIIASALAAALADPRSSLARRCDGADLGVLDPAWEILSDITKELPADQLGIGERRVGAVEIAALRGWLELPAERREHVHVNIFGLVMTKLCPSYETEYCEWKDTTHRSQELADIAGFYSAFGLVPGRSFPERVDHVSLELEFLALLLEKQVHALQSEGATGDVDEHVSVCKAARGSFLRDHAAWWMPTFARLLEKRAEAMLNMHADLAPELRMMIGVAQVLSAWIGAERHAADIAPSRRLISPSIMPQDADDGCGTCSGCAEQ